MFMGVLVLGTHEGSVTRHSKNIFALLLIFWCARPRLRNVPWGTFLPAFSPISPKSKSLTRGQTF